MYIYFNFLYYLWFIGKLQDMSSTMSSTALLLISFLKAALKVQGP
jgi:hypothetical protein